MYSRCTKSECSVWGTERICVRLSIVLFISFGLFDRSVIYQMSEIRMNSSVRFVKSINRKSEIGTIQFRFWSSSKIQPFGNQTISKSAEIRTFGFRTSIVPIKYLSSTDNNANPRQDPWAGSRQVYRVPRSILKFNLAEFFLS